MRFRITFQVTTRASAEAEAQRQEVSLTVTAGSRRQAIAATKRSVHRNPDQRFRLIECVGLIERAARRRPATRQEARA